MRKIDYTRFGEGKPRDDLLEGINRRWWVMADDEEIVESITATLEHLKKRQAARITQHEVNARLYGNQSILGFGGLGYLRMAGAGGILKERISYNVVQSASDTITAKATKNRPRAYFLTSGGNYRQQRKAKKLNKFVDGVFYENAAYDNGPIIFRDGTVFGDGFTKVFIEDRRVKWERTLASELWADELEGFYGQPRTLHQVKNVDRQVMCEAFPEFEDKINEVDPVRPDESGTYQAISDLIQVRESWHLPSGPKAKDGCHVISVGNAVLYKGPWDHDFFPFARFRWCPRLFGFWSQGLAEQIQNIQMEINKLLQLIQRSFHLGGTYKVLMENTSKIVPEHINNEVGAIIKYSGTKPEYVVPPLVPPEIFNHLLTLKNAAYEQAGISMLSASSQKPAGLNSGRALREYEDIESDRFQTIGKAYEAYFLELAKITVKLAKTIGGKYEVVAPDKRFTHTIDWKDVNLDEDSYVMQIYPVSSLPKDPAGRLETITEYMQAGLITPRRGKKLLDFPDLEMEDSLSNASEDYIEMVMDKIIDEGELISPEPYDDLNLANEIAMEHYAWGKAQGMEPERLELLRIYMKQVDWLKQQAATQQAQQQASQQQAQQAQGAPAQPQGQAAPPPQNPMIKNVPGVTGTTAQA